MKQVQRRIVAGWALQFVMRVVSSERKKQNKRSRETSYGYAHIYNRQKHLHEIEIGPIYNVVFGVLWEKSENVNEKWKGFP